VIFLPRSSPRNTVASLEEVRLSPGSYSRVRRRGIARAGSDVAAGTRLSYLVHAGFASACHAVPSRHACWDSFGDFGARPGSHVIAGVPATPQRRLIGLPSASTGL